LMLRPWVAFCSNEMMTRRLLSFILYADGQLARKREHQLK
jgi:hypothetical protein